MPTPDLIQSIDARLRELDGEKKRLAEAKRILRNGTAATNGTPTKTKTKTGKKIGRPRGSKNKPRVAA